MMRFIVFLALFCWLTIANASTIIFPLSAWNLSSTNAVTNSIKVWQVGQIVGGHGNQVGLPIWLNTTNGFFTNSFAQGNYAYSILDGAPYPYNQDLYFQSYADSNTYYVTNAGIWMSGGTVIVQAYPPTVYTPSSGIAFTTNGSTVAISSTNSSSGLDTNALHTTNTALQSVAGPIASPGFVGAATSATNVTGAVSASQLTGPLPAISGALLTAIPTVPLTSGVSGILPVANGGLGNATGNASGLTNQTAGGVLSGANLIHTGSVYTNNANLGFPTYGVSLFINTPYIYYQEPNSGGLFSGDGNATYPPSVPGGGMWTPNYFTVPTNGVYLLVDLNGGNAGDPVLCQVYASNSVTIPVDLSVQGNLNLAVPIPVANGGTGNSTGAINLDTSSNYFPNPRQNTQIYPHPYFAYTTFWSEGLTPAAADVTNKITEWIGNGLAAGLGSNNLFYMLDAGQYTSRAANGKLTNTSWLLGFAPPVAYAHSKGIKMGSYVAGNSVLQQASTGTNIYFDAGNCAADGFDIIKIDSPPAGLTAQKQWFCDWGAALEQHSMLSMATVDPTYWPPFNQLTYGNVPWSIFDSVNGIQSSQMAFPSTFAQVTNNILSFGTNGWLVHPQHYVEVGAADMLNAPTNVAIVSLTFVALLEAPIETSDPTAANIKLITNANFLQIWWDPLGVSASMIASTANSQTWAKPMSNNRFAVGVFNMVTNSGTNITFNLNLLNPWIAAADVFDAWNNVDLGVFTGSFTASNIITNGCGLYIVTPVVTAPIYSANGIGSTATNFGSITATGWTNALSVNIQGYWTATTGISVTNFDNAGVAWFTNTSLTSEDVLFRLQPGAKIKAPSGLTGNWHAF